MYAIREAAAAIRRAPLLTCLSAAMVALALFVVGIFAVVSYNLHLALANIEERVEVVVYVRDDARLEAVAGAEDSLLGLEEVRAVRFVSRDQALLRAQEELPEFREIFGSVAANPLPASLEVELHPGSRYPGAVSRVAMIAEGLPIAEEVVYGREWVDRIFVLRRAGAVATLLLGSAFGLVAALIIATAVRMAIFSHRDEILIMRLVGATNGFVRRPFLLEGFVTGCFGGILAFGLTYGVYLTGHRSILPMEWLPAYWSAAGVLSGGILGLAASAVAIHKHLHEI